MFLDHGLRARPRSLERRIQLACDAASGRLEEKWEETVQEGRDAARGHLHAVPAREEPVLGVGLADVLGMGGERVSHFYLAAINAMVTSSMRFEKPHSLSYQLDTFTNRPETFVSVASKTDERGSWLKSTETRGAVL